MILLEKVWMQAGEEERVASPPRRKKSSLKLSSLFEDPITLETMEDALVASCGHSFSQASIMDYVEKNGKCPVCLKPLQQTDLAPNYKLREAITQYLNYKESAESEEEDESGEKEERDLIKIPVVSTEALVKQISPNFKSKKDEFRLIVEVLHAKSLANQRTFGTSEPYCRISFQGKVHNTSAMPANLNPIWNEGFLFEVKQEKEPSEKKDMRLVKEETHPPICFHIWDKQLLTEHFMGGAEIEWQAIIQAEDKMLEVDLPLKGRKGKKDYVSGILHVKVRYVNLRDLRHSKGAAPQTQTNFILQVTEEKARPLRISKPKEGSSSSQNDEEENASSSSGDSHVEPIILGSPGPISDEDMARELQRQFDEELVI